MMGETSGGVPRRGIRRSHPLQELAGGATLLDAADLSAGFEPMAGICVSSGNPFWPLHLHEAAPAFPCPDLQLYACNSAFLTYMVETGNGDRTSLTTSVLIVQ